MFPLPLMCLVLALTSEKGAGQSLFILLEPSGSGSRAGLAEPLLGGQRGTAAVTIWKLEELVPLYPVGYQRTHTKTNKKTESILD